MIKFDAENSSDNVSDTNGMLMAKVKDLFSATKERLKKYPQHPLHSQLKEEILDLQMDIDFNGTANSRKFVLKVIFA